MSRAFRHIVFTAGFTAALGVCLGACKDEPPAPPAAAPAAAPATAPAPAAASCEQRSDALIAWMDTLATEGPSGALQEAGGARVPRSETLFPAPVAAAPRVEINDSHLVFQGQVVAEVAALASGEAAVARLFAAPAARGAEGAAAQPGEVHVYASESTPWRVLVDVATGLSVAGYERIGLVMRTDSTLAPPPLPALSQGDDGSPDETSKRLVDQAWSGCPAALPLTVAAARQGARAQRKAAFDALRKALLGCECAIDDSWVRPVVWGLYGRGASREILTLKLVELGEGERIAAPADARWADVAARVAEASGPLRLAVSASAE
ncbi:hypothetical protein [Haliangium ochraceum]|uniref:Uncharacterized protein n=1 Tax=Haliangium ochraceum (strain DSM 14365 / JCM 11303 / SMP-2) TaxID=502025 RepID=D0LZA9_HALO1|nr:hypothetical protein [Haliangium ochraceum]ACY16371.1 hypothetical protein Hoch_3872 [Haliangium ochraceum DSM 14365]